MNELKQSFIVLDDAIKEATNSFEKLKLWWRKVERHRMRQLVYDYPHIKERLIQPVETKTKGNTVILTDTFFEDMDKMSEGELKAINDWMKVLNGHNPNEPDNMIHGFLEI